MASLVVAVNDWINCECRVFVLILYMGDVPYITVSTREGYGLYRCCKAAPRTGWALEASCDALHTTRMQIER